MNILQIIYTRHKDNIYVTPNVSFQCVATVSAILTDYIKLFINILLCIYQTLFIKEVIY